jgi:hypothetical protein
MDKYCFHSLFVHISFKIQLMRVKEFLDLNQKVPNFQFCMISWKLTRTNIVTGERIIDGHFGIQKSLKRNTKIHLHGGKLMRYIIPMLGL